MKMTIAKKKRLSWNIIDRNHVSGLHCAKRIKLAHFSKAFGTKTYHERVFEATVVGFDEIPVAVVKQRRAQRAWRLTSWLGDLAETIPERTRTKNREKIDEHDRPEERRREAQPAPQKEKNIAEHIVWGGEMAKDASNKQSTANDEQAIVEQGGSTHKEIFPVIQHFIRRRSRHLLQASSERSDIESIGQAKQHNDRETKSVEWC